MRTEHIVFRCEAAGNRQHGFTNNSNPYMCLVECRAVNNSGDNIRYKVYAGSRLKREFKTKNCTVGNDDDFQPERLLGEILKEVKMKS